MVGRELPVLETAGGRAYLAFVSAPERQHILSALRSELGDEKVDYHQDGPLSFILKRTLDLGVGFRVKGFNNRTMSISAPIMGQERPIGCLTVIWIASAMKFDEVIRTHKDALIAAARAISRDLMQLSAETGSWQGSQPDRVEQVSGNSGRAERKGQLEKGIGADRSTTERLLLAVGARKSAVVEELPKNGPSVRFRAGVPTAPARPLFHRKRKSICDLAMSPKCRLCCKSLFAPLIANFSSCRRGFRVNMWGTSSPGDKLTGDFVTSLTPHLSAIVACFDFWRKICHPAFSDFCNTICQKRP